MRPEDDHDLCARERVLDHPVESRPGRDRAIPPDGHACGFERLRERLSVRPVQMEVADEDVAHDSRASRRRTSNVQAAAAHASRPMKIPVNASKNSGSFEVLTRITRYATLLIGS